MSFFEELKRRSVVKVAVAYAVAGWLLIQVIDTVLPNLGAPQWVVSTLMVLILLGFPVALVLAWALQITPEGIKTQQHADDANLQASGLKPNSLLILSAVLAIGFIVFDAFLLPGDENSDEMEPVANTDQQSLSTLLDEKLAVPVTDKVIAVLPFRDLNPNGEQAYLGEGISEEILNRLTRINGLRVIGRTSSFYFRDQEGDYNAIRETLGAEYLLLGSISLSQNTLRIRAQLLDTASGTQLWSDTYGRPLADIFAIQDEISQAVADAMEITLSVGDLGIQPGMTDNVDAWQEYMKGHQLFWEGAFDRSREVISHYERALALDPDFYLISAELLNLYENMIPFVLPDDLLNSPQRIAEADAHIRQVENFPYVHLIEGWRHAQAREWLAADQEFVNYIQELDKYGKNSTESLRAMSSFLQVIGRTRESVVLMERARALDPLSVNFNWFLADGYLRVGELEQALETIDVALTQSQTQSENLYGSALLAAMAMGDREELEKRLAAIEPFEPPLADGQKVNSTLGMYVDTPEAGVAKVREFAAVESLPPLYVGVLSAWAAYYGDPELALELQFLSYSRPGGGNIIGDIFRPVYRDMRQLVGFKDLVRQDGLVDYWRAIDNWGDYCRPLGSDDFECF